VRHKHKIKHMVSVKITFEVNSFVAITKPHQIGHECAAQTQNQTHGECKNHV
jgi:hypothetical protein